MLSQGIKVELVGGPFDGGCTTLLPEANVNFKLPWYSKPIGNSDDSQSEWLLYQYSPTTKKADFKGYETMKKGKRA